MTPSTHPLIRAARLIAASILILGAWPAQAGVAAPAHTILVTTLAESPGSPGDCTLGEAIQAANADHAVDACAAGSGADTIVLPAGTYTLTKSFSPNVGSAAFVISTTMTLQGNGASLTRGGPLTNTVSFFFVSPAGQLTLRNLTLKHGLAQGDKGGDGTGPSGAGGDGGSGLGGAIFSDGQVALDGVTFISNIAQGGGGGAGNSGGSARPGGAGGMGAGGAIFSNGPLVIEGAGATFFGNQALGGAGGAGGHAGVAGASGGQGGKGMGGAIDSNAGLTATTGSLVFSANSALGGNGGSGGTLTGAGGSGGVAQGGALRSFISLWMAYGGGLFAGNEAAGGYGGNDGALVSTGPAGAGFGGGLDTSGQALVNGATFQQNSAREAAVSNPNILGTAEGAGVFNDGVLTLTQSSLIENSVRAGEVAFGAGLMNVGVLSMADSLVSGNRLLTTTTPMTNTFDGAGLGLSGSAVIVRSAIVSNTALSGGGDSSLGAGIAVLNTTLALTNTTIAYNESDYGAGLSSHNSTVSLTHATIVGNKADYTGGGVTASGSGLLLLRNDLIAGNAHHNCYPYLITFSDGGGNLEDANDCELTQPTSMTNTAPLIGPLADNGGGTLTFALLPHSPALNAALAAFCPDSDQRGVPRPAGPGCDIGAFELNFPVWLPLARR